jgi:hypothetical protein
MFNKKGASVMVIRSLMMFSVFMLCLELSLPSTSVYAQIPEARGDMIKFYGFADTISTFPPSPDSLRIIKQKFVQGFYVAFIGFQKSPKVRIVAVTPEPIKNVKKDISLVVEFNGIYPRAGKVTSWGYIFDRNKDGKIDFLSLLGGAAPYDRGDMPEDYPVRKVQLNMDQIEFMVSHCQLVFNYWADDNYDGKLDGLIHIDMDPARDWVQDQIVVRSKKFNYKFNDVWAFQYSMDNRADTVIFHNNTIPYRPIDNTPPYITEKTFKDKTEILQLINRAANMAGLRAQDFVNGREEEE